MAISIDRILDVSAHKYFHGKRKAGDYDVIPLTYSRKKVRTEKAKQYFARRAPKETEVVLDFKLLKEYYPSIIIFGVALIPKEKK